MKTTRFLPLLLLLLSAERIAGQTAAHAAPIRPAPVATMSDLMVHVLYPASDPIFYIGSREPST